MNEIFFDRLFITFNVYFKMLTYFNREVYILAWESMQNPCPCPVAEWLERRGEWYIYICHRRAGSKPVTSWSRAYTQEMDEFMAFRKEI